MAGLNRSSKLQTDSVQLTFINHFLRRNNDRQTSKSRKTAFVPSSSFFLRALTMIHANIESPAGGRCSLIRRQLSWLSRSFSSLSIDYSGTDWTVKWEKVFRIESVSVVTEKWAEYLSLGVFGWLPAYPNDDLATKATNTMHRNNSCVVAIKRRPFNQISSRLINDHLIIIIKCKWHSISGYH